MKAVQTRPCGVCGAAYRTTLPSTYFAACPAADRCKRCAGRQVPTPGHSPPPVARRPKACCGALNGHRAGCRVIHDPTSRHTPAPFPAWRVP